MTQLGGVHDTITDGSLFPIDSYLRFNTTTSKADDGLSVFLAVRRNLFGIACRMLRSAAEAEDIVQDVWLRWQTTNRGVVLDPPAFLMTITARMCINLCQSARSRREIYAEPWLSEPVDSGVDPCGVAERKESLKSAVLMLLETLRPAERAAYVLREAFDYSSRQIADILKMKEANVRQLLTRARRHIAEERRARASSTEQRRLLVAIIDAAENGNLAELEGLFASDLAVPSDEDDRGAMNQDSTTNWEHPHPDPTFTWCRQKVAFSVLTNTTAICEGVDRGEDQDHGTVEGNSLSFPPTSGLFRRADIACK
jgi:RNA polymerase sigma factor (sigma-70 family)